MAKKRGPDTFISRLFTRHGQLRRVEGRRAREMARVMKDVKRQATSLIERNMTTFREAGEYIDSAAAVARANQTVAGIDALMAQRADWATSEVLSMRQEAWKQGVSDIEFAAERLPGGVQAQMQASFGQAFPEAAFSAVEHPVLGVAPDAMFNGVRAGTTQGMRNILVNAVVSGESVQDTGRAISDALDLSVAAGERIARTNVNAMYNEAQKSVYDANADILAGYAWEATLDDRTSQVCFMLHGQFWPLGSKTPGPPAHWNCRSILVPVFKDPAVQALLDDTPRRARQYTKTGKMRDIMVKGTTTPEQWARRQPAEISLRVTGSKLKNSLFRRKLIGFDDLVDPSLRVRTDQEIIKRAAALHPGNKALQKQARAMGIKTVPSPASVRKADAALAKKQPWDKPQPPPETGGAPPVPPTPPAPPAAPTAPAAEPTPPTPAAGPIPAPAADVERRLALLQAQEQTLSTEAMRLDRQIATLKRQNRSARPGTTAYRRFTRSLADLEAQKRLKANRIRELFVEQGRVRGTAPPSVRVPTAAPTAPAPPQPSPVSERFATQADWERSLSPTQKRVLEDWQQGTAVQQFRHFDNLPDDAARRAWLASETSIDPVKYEGIIDDWKIFNSSLDRSPVYQGNVWRGLSDVDPREINAWVAKSKIDFGAASSATADREVAEEFAFQYTRKGRQAVVFEIRSGHTGSRIPDLVQGMEYQEEVVLRAETSYRIIGRSMSRIEDTTVVNLMLEAS